MKQPNKFPNSVLILLALIFGLAVFLTTRGYYRTDQRIETKQSEVTATKKRIDTLRAKRDAATKNLKNYSNHQREISFGLVKSLPHEKPIIRDTTYAAMCKYITDYPGQP